jgi:hypothetical protein
MNPLISDELVSRVGKAGTDANNAVALALVALKSTFTAQAVNQEAEAASVLEYWQAVKLYEVLTVSPKHKNENDTEQNDKKDCLKDLLYHAYTRAEAAYKEEFRANTETIKELNAATANLNQAQIKLKSLQLSLSAANAAALAS